MTCKSLNLNPIDHLCDILKRKVRAQQLQLNLISIWVLYGRAHKGKPVYITHGAIWACYLGSVLHLYVVILFLKYNKTLGCQLEIRWVKLALSLLSAKVMQPSISNTHVQ